MIKGALGKTIIIIIAAKLAPLVIPITSGEARGFFTTPCMIVPEIAKLLPTINPKSVLGIRYSFRIKSSCINKLFITLTGLYIVAPTHKLINILMINIVTTSA